MGSSRWDDAIYTSKRSEEILHGVAPMAYSSSIAKGEVEAKTHETLDPSKLKAGVREVRDSTEHPESVPIFVGLDVTGSMASVPAEMQQTLPTLMGLLLKQGFVTDPAICVAGIGDAAYDKSPFQVSQFESGIEIDDSIANIYMEGGGGGNMHESYELALLYLARCVSSDAWEKRQKKGYAFIICDEELNLKIQKSHVQKVFGDTIAIQDDLKTEDILSEVLEKWELFCIIPNRTSHYNTLSYSANWRRLLNERVLKLEDPNAICELIATTIGILEDNLDLDSVTSILTAAGVSAGASESVSKAVSVLSGREVGKLSGTGLAAL